MAASYPGIKKLETLLLSYQPMDLEPGKLSPFFELFFALINESFLRPLQNKYLESRKSNASQRKDPLVPIQQFCLSHLNDLMTKFVLYRADFDTAENNEKIHEQDVYQRHLEEVREKSNRGEMIYIRRER